MNYTEIVYILIFILMMIDIVILIVDEFKGNVFNFYKAFWVLFISIMFFSK